MKIKYEIEANSSGYTEKIWIDGELKNTQVHVAVPGGSKRKSGKDWEDVVDNDIADNIDAFMGFDLFRMCNQREDE